MGPALWQVGVGYESQVLHARPSPPPSAEDSLYALPYIKALCPALHHSSCCYHLPTHSSTEALGDMILITEALGDYWVI